MTGRHAVGRCCCLFEGAHLRPGRYAVQVCSAGRQAGRQAGRHVKQPRQAAQVSSANCSVRHYRPAQSSTSTGSSRQAAAADSPLALPSHSITPPQRSPGAACSLVRPPKLLLLVEPPLERRLLLPRAAAHAWQHFLAPNARVCAPEGGDAEVSGGGRRWVEVGGGLNTGACRCFCGGCLLRTRQLHSRQRLLAAAAGSNHSKQY